MAVEHAVAEVAEDQRLGLLGGDRLGQFQHDLIGDRAVVERVDLQKPIAAGNDRVLVGGRPGLVDDRLALDAGLAQALEDEILQRILAEHGGKDDIGAGRIADAWRRSPAPADVIASCLSNSTLMVGVLVWPPIMLVWVNVSTMVSPTTWTRRPPNLSSVCRSSSKVRSGTLHQRHQLFDAQRRRRRFDHLAR